MQMISPWLGVLTATVVQAMKIVQYTILVTQEEQVLSVEAARII